MRKTPERTYRCRVRPCQRVKGDANHWFVATIDTHGRLSFEKFTSSLEFEKAAGRHGALEICSEACMHTHMSRWASGGITSAERPGNASPAVLDLKDNAFDGTLTCWVSDVYKTNASNILSNDDSKHQARIVNYMDDGQKRSIWCFNDIAFQRVERTAGSYAMFKVKRRGEYVNVIDVLYIDGKSPLHGASKNLHHGDTEAQRTAK